MSRLPGGNIIQQKPKMNIYTALVVAAMVASIMALVVMYLRAKTLFPPGGLLN